MLLSVKALMLVNDYAELANEIMASLPSPFVLRWPALINQDSIERANKVTWFELVDMPPNLETIAAHIILSDCILARDAYHAAGTEKNL